MSKCNFEQPYQLSKLYTTFRLQILSELSHNELFRLQKNQQYIRGGASQQYEDNQDEK